MRDVRMFLAAGVLLGAAGCAQGESGDGPIAGILIDVNDTDLGAFLGESFVRSGGYAYFTAENGRELWRTDGTAAGTSVMLQLDEGAISGIADVAGSPYFFVNMPGENGLPATAALWVSDGSQNGTRLLADIGYTGFTQHIAALGSIAIVITGTVTPGQPCDLWRSDGTDAGTTFETSFGGNGIDSMCSVVRSTFDGERVWFAAETSAEASIYRTDGTAAGTEPVDVVLAPVYSIASLGDSVFVNGLSGVQRHRAGAIEALSPWASTSAVVAGTKLLYSAAEGSNPSALAQDLFVVDEDSSPILLVPIASAADSLCATGSVAYFRSGGTLWTSDGTVSGTFTIDVPATPIQIAAAGGDGFVRLSDDRFGVARQGVFHLLDVPAAVELESAADLGGRLAFAAGQPWITDGTPNGTHEIRHIGRHTAGSSMSELALAAGTGRAVFSAYDGENRGIWSSDGSRGGTHRIASNFAGPFSGPVSAGGAALFAADGELWRTDGTAAGTSPLGAFQEHGLVESGGLAYHATVDAGTARIFSNDGSGAASVVVDEFPGVLARFEVATFGERTLITTNPYPSGTPSMLRLDGVVLTSGYGLSEATVVDDSIYVFGFEADGTSLLREISATGSADVDSFDGPNDFPHGLTVVGSQACFAVSTEFTPQLRCVSPGNTPEVVFSEAAIGSISFIIALDSAHAYFVCGTSSASTLYLTDGASVTPLVSFPLAFSKLPMLEGLTVISGVLVFRVHRRDGTSELWRSDGTAAGTFLVAPLAERDAEENAAGRFVALPERLLFPADDGLHGVEPWFARRDGTIE